MIFKGEMVAEIGPSGSGRSTLLNILSFMDSCSMEKYHLNGMDTFSHSDRVYSNLRSSVVSFIFQDYNLLDNYKEFADLWYQDYYGKVNYCNPNRVVIYYI